jgi:hypothetical protein
MPFGPAVPLPAGVGAGYLLAREPVAGRLAPDIRRQSDEAHEAPRPRRLHCGVAFQDEDYCTMALLNLGCAAGNTAATLLERRAHRRWARAECRRSDHLASTDSSSVRRANSDGGTCSVAAIRRIVSHDDLRRRTVIDVIRAPIAGSELHATCALEHHVEHMVDFS